MARLDVAPHLTADEIDRRYRTCPDAAEKARWLLLRLLTRADGPPSVADAARLAGFTPRWGRALVHRYNAGGPAALADGRRGNGAAPKLTPGRRAELLAALRSPPPDGGLWSGPKVIALVRDRWAVAVGHSTGWQWLRDLGFRLVVPRPRHPKAASADEQRRWLRPPPAVDGRPAGGPPGEGGRAVVRGRGPARPEAGGPTGVGVAGHPPDEQRAAPVRVGPGVRVRPPGDRAEPPVAAPARGRRADGEALAEFARWADPDGAKVLVVVIDKAGYHTAKTLAVPANARLHFLPGCTPELQPAERLWPVLREAVAG